MGGETDLSILLGGLTATLQPGVYVFATLPPEAVPAGLPVRMRFEETEGTTLILLAQDAKEHGLSAEFACRMITLQVHSALEAVGFIAHIATELAREDMGVNPVSGFFHDHLFVPEGREQDALRIIDGIRQKAQSRRSK